MRRQRRAPLADHYHAGRPGSGPACQAVGRPRPAQSLVVDVDAARCQRFGFCEHEAPEFFRLQGNGRLAYRPHVPAAGAERVIRAVEVCPARAIALRRLPTTVVTAGTQGPSRRRPPEFRGATVAAWTAVRRARRPDRSSATRRRRPRPGSRSCPISVASASSASRQARGSRKGRADDDRERTRRVRAPSRVRPAAGRRRRRGPRRHGRRRGAERQASTGTSSCCTTSPRRRMTGRPVPRASSPGTSGVRDALMRVHAADGVQLASRSPRGGLDPDEHVVYADTGERFGYDPWSSPPARLPFHPGAGRCRSPACTPVPLSDAWALRHELRAARRVAVVGAGLTGCEVAHAVRSLARELRADRPRPAGARPPTGPAGRAPGHPGDRPGRRRAAAGPARHRARPGRRGWVLALDDGDEVLADVVVTTTGERPDTAWLPGIPGLDPATASSATRRCGWSAPGRRRRGHHRPLAEPALRHDTVPCRSVDHRARAGAGRCPHADDGRGLPGAFTHVPRFWSDQFGLRIQVCGVLPAEAEITLTEQRPGGSTSRGPARRRLPAGRRARRPRRRQRTAGLHRDHAHDARDGRTPGDPGARPVCPPPPVADARPAAVLVPAVTAPAVTAAVVEPPAARRAITLAPTASGDVGDAGEADDGDERGDVAPVTELDRPRRLAGLPAPAAHRRSAARSRSPAALRRRARPARPQVPPDRPPPAQVDTARLPRTLERVHVRATPRLAGG